MLNITRYRHAIVLLSLLSLSGCASNSNLNARKYRAKSWKSSLPHVPAKLMPGGSLDNWRYLGTSQDSLLAIEINESSIKTTDDLNQFQDRKTVVDQSKFDYQGLSPNYKYSLSWWQLNCNLKQYTISSTSLYDINGKLLKNYSFGQANAWSPINNGSIAELQYNYLCLGNNRNIGY